MPPNPFLFTGNTPIAGFASRPIGVASAVRFEMSSDTAAQMSTGVQSSAPPPSENRARSTAAAPTVDGRAAARPVVVTARRTLTLVQRRSFDAFVDAGAVMAPDFSLEELRSAFRWLARQYHPDRHPRATDAEKMALSRRFAAVTTDYEVLLTALDAYRT